MKHKDFNFSGTRSFCAGSLTEARWPQRLEAGSSPFHNPAAQQAAVPAVKGIKVGQPAAHASKQRRTAGKTKRNRLMLTSIEQTISNTRPRSIHASSWAFTRHVHGRHSCAIDIVTNVSDVSGCVPQVAATLH